MDKKVLLKDIAKEPKISATTVSFILSGQAEKIHISEKLTQKALKYIEKRGYRKNEVAKTLANGKTKTIGLMVEKMSDSFFACLAYYIEKMTYQKGYKVIYCSTENDPQNIKELINCSWIDT